MSATALRSEPLVAVERGGGLSSLEEEEARLLVVDDEPENVEELAVFLRQKGYACETAFDGNEALKKVEENSSIAIVLADIRMPGMDGLELASKIRERCSGDRQIEIILLTGHAGLEAAVHAIHVGACDFLTKPVSLSDLRLAVERACQGVRLRRLDHRYRLMVSQELDNRTDEVTKLMAELEAVKQERFAGAATTPLEGSLKDIFLPALAFEFLPTVETLASVVGLLESDDKLRAVEGADLCVRHVAQAAREIREFTHKLTDLVAAMCGRSPITPSPFPLRDALRQVTRACAAKAEAAGAFLETHIPDDLPVVNSDRGRLEQALTCLLEGAINLSSIGTAIRFSVEADEPSIGIRVCLDASAGEDDEEGPRSSPFSCDGLGLGYALAVRLINLLGGTVKLDMDADAGPTFVVTIPR